jgi:hypothetical protein
MSDKIVLKSTTDSEATLVSRAEGASAGSPDEIQPGELIVQREVDRTTLYSVDNAGSVVELPGRPGNPPGELGQLSDTGTSSGGSFFQDFEPGTPVNYTFTSNTFLETTGNTYIGTGSPTSNGSGSVPMNFDNGAILDQTKRYDYFSFLYAQESIHSTFPRGYPHWGSVGTSYTTGGGWSLGFSASGSSVRSVKLYWNNGTTSSFSNIGNTASNCFAGYTWNSIHFLFDWGVNPAPSGTRENAPVSVSFCLNGNRYSIGLSSVQYTPIEVMQFKFLSGFEGNLYKRYIDNFYLAQSDVAPWNGLPFGTRGVTWDEAISAAYGSTSLNDASTLVYNNGIWGPGTPVKSKNFTDLSDVSISSEAADPYFDNVAVLINPYSLNGNSRVYDVITGTEGSNSGEALLYDAIEGGTRAVKVITNFTPTLTQAENFRLDNTDSFTVEFWGLIGPTNRSLFLQLYQNTGKPWEITYIVNDWGIEIRFEYRDLSTGGQLYTAQYYTTGTEKTRGAWTHVAFTRTGNSLLAFVNGVLVDTFAFNPVNWKTTFDYFSITANTSSQLIYMQGFRITKGVARYTSNFTPPRSLPLSAASTGLEQGQTITYDGSDWTNATAVSGGTFGSG